MSEKEILKIFYKLLDNVKDFVYIKKFDKEKGDFIKIYVNDKLASTLGVPKEFIIGKTHQEILPEHIIKFCEETDRKVIESKKTLRTTSSITFRNKNYHFEFVKVPIFDENGEISAIAGWVKDITDLKEANEREKRYNQRLKNLLTKDSVTGLLNKYSLQKTIKRFQNKELDFVILLFDIKEFKVINQIYGFGTGDYILKKLAQHLKKVVHNDIKQLKEKEIHLARINSDMFAVVYPENDHEKAYEVAKKLKRKLERYKIHLKSGDVYIPDFTVAVYAQSLSRERKKPQFVLADMELTLLRAKENKEEIAVYDPELDSNARFLKFYKERELITNAIESNRVVPFLQPIYFVENKSIYAYEVLARIKKDEEFIRPSEFIDTAIRSGLISKIDDKIMENVRKIMPGIKNAKLFINLSALSLNNDFFKNHLEKSQCNQLVLEITEQVAVKNVDFLKDLIKNKDIKFAIDDFGTGYASLKLVVDLSTTKITRYLKIDGSLIKDITKKEENKKIVETIVKLAKDLNLKTVAEFVEDEETYKTLKELGVDLAQGFYFSAPKPYYELINEAV